MVATVTANDIVAAGFAMDGAAPAFAQEAYFDPDTFKFRFTYQSEELTAVPSAENLLARLQRQVRSQIALHPAFHRRDPFRRQAAPAALVGVGGVREAVAQYCLPRGERRAYHLGQVLGRDHRADLGAVN